MSMRGISKAFGPNRVLREVDFDVRAGEVHALLGENGAGKSTLMKVLMGVHKADAGAVTLAGRNIAGDTVQDNLSQRHRHDLSGAQPPAQPDGRRQHPHRPRTAPTWLDRR